MISELKLHLQNLKASYIIAILSSKYSFFSYIMRLHRIISFQKWNPSLQGSLSLFSTLLNYISHIKKKKQTKISFDITITINCQISLLPLKFSLKVLNLFHPIILIFCLESIPIPSYYQNLYNV